MTALFESRTRLLASAALVGLAVSTPAYAQDAQTSSSTTAVSQASNVAPTNQSTSDENSEAIIVTAQKRAQVLLDVPQSVTVVGGDTLIEWQYVMATAMLALLPPAVVVLLMQRWFVKGLVDTEK
jgi:outer membrane receptor for ferric coprogen and ferric-rhodotorulic acid